MFLYDNHKKLLAANETGVKQIGFSSLESFFEEVEDLADLFEQKPGYVYKFKNFSWIDFIIFNSTKEHKVFLSSVEVELPIHVTLLQSRRGEQFYIVTLGEKSADVVIGIPDMQERLVEETLIEPIEESIEEEKAQKDSVALEIELPKEEEKIELLEIEQPKESEEPLTTEGFSLTIEEERETTSKTSEEPISLIPEQKAEEKIELLIEEASSQESETSLEKLELNTEEEKPIELAISIEPDEKGPLYDFHKALQELEIDEEMLKELLNEFVDQAKQLKEEIYSALHEGDIVRAKELIHKIKGAVANLRIASADEILAQTHGVQESDKLFGIMDRFYEHLQELIKEFAYMDIVESRKENAADKVLEQTETKRGEEEGEIELAPQIKKKPGVEEIEANIQQARQELGLDEEDIKELIQEYLFRALGAKNHILQLKRARKEEELHRLLHQLKGSALNLRLHTFAKILDDIKKGIPDAFEVYDKELERFANYLNIDLQIELTPRMIEENAKGLGVDTNTYKEFVKEFLNELESAIEKDELEKELKKLHSAAINLRLSFLVTALEALIERKEPAHCLQKIEEIVSRYKGSL